MTEELELYKRLSELRLRTQHVRITLLTFQDKPIKEIQGLIQSGSMSVNGSSAVRRTINLSMLVTPESANIEDAQNDISINKKVKIEVGCDNPFRQENKEPIIWFKCGIYVLTSANTSRSTSGYTISITGQDKMCLLNGTCGGTLPATVRFHEKEIQQSDGSKIIKKVKIFDIIYEAVHHWGGEEPDKIIISDIDDQVRKLVKYVGTRPIYFADDYSSFSFNDFSPSIKIDQGKDVGYELMDFTYPGELILKAGDTVVSLLDKIKNTLGNFEYFYDLDGNFVFQEIKNYLNTGSPLKEYAETLSFNDASDCYIRNYSNAKYLYSLTDLDSTTQITRNPKWSEIKNDFCVWGERESASGAKFGIRYHLVIDKKPILNYALQYMWKTKDEAGNLDYKFGDESAAQKAGVLASNSKDLIGIPCSDNEWREELYRCALLAQVKGSVTSTPYDAEMISEWRKLYPLWYDKTWKMGWNKTLLNNPKGLDFWIDFIDSGGPMGYYSVSEIGRRSKVVTNDKLKSVYNLPPPDIIFVSKEELEARQSDFETLGQKFFLLDDSMNNLFQISTTGASCFDQIREMLYQNLSCNTTIQITCLPKYYLEPNNIIHIRDDASGIDGNYLVTQFTLPLAYNGTMSITATEVLTRV